MPDFVYQTASELLAIERELMPVLTADDPIFRHFPIVTTPNTVLQWEIQDNIQGLQQARGLDGLPPMVQRTGSRLFTATPGVYGEYIRLNEHDLLNIRRAGSYSDRANIRELVAQAQLELLTRRLSRVSFIAWTLATTGTFAVPALNGATVHQDTFSITPYTATTGWATRATATPIQDMRNMKLLAAGTSALFNAQSTLYVNAITANDLMANQNAADLGGKRGAGLSSVTGLADINQIFLAEDLPRVEVYEGGYYTDAGVWTRWIPNGRGVLFGNRPGYTIGEYRMTFSLDNGPEGGAGPYTVVKASEGPPKSVEVHDGHNGGPVIFYPRALVRATL